MQGTYHCPCSSLHLGATQLRSPCVEAVRKLEPELLAGIPVARATVVDQACGDPVNHDIDPGYSPPTG